MRKWEDIIKDKLEGSDVILPDSVFEEFRSRRDALASASRRLPWIWVAVPAVAAGLAAVLLLSRPKQSQSPAPVAVVTEVTDVADVEEVEDLEVVEDVADRTSEVVEDVVPVKDAADTAETRSEEKVVEKAEETIEEKTEEKAVEKTEEKAVQTSEPVVTPPGVPVQPSARKKMNGKVLPAAGIVSGGGLLAAALTPAIGSGNTSSGQHGPFMGDPRDRLLEDPVHYFPVRLGLSAMIPISDRWFVSTGLNYSLYLSSFNYRIAGKTTQAAHYLGVPVKINWVMASNQLFDVYLGGGLEGDKCLGEDGFSLSLQGAGGIQMNLSRRLGIYLEPELSWRIPTGTPKLETYRSTHPLLFTVAAGLRFRIGE